MMYFSIIIPTLNEELVISRLLNNLEQQTCTDFEVLVVDGNSVDNTSEIVNNFKATYPLQLIHTARSNVSHQRNVGAAKAQAKTLVFLDADTQLSKNYLEKLRQAFDSKHPHVINTWVKADSNRKNDHLVAHSINLLFETSRLVGKPTCCGAMIAVKRGAFEDVGGFDEQTSYAEDTQLMQKLVDFNYKYTILSHPRYTFSMRRFRSEGTLDAFYQYLKMSLNLMRIGYHQPVNYPMGGHAFQLVKNKTVTPKQLQQLFTDIKKASKTQTSKIIKLVNYMFPN